MNPAIIIFGTILGMTSVMGVAHLLNSPPPGSSTFNLIAAFGFVNVAR